MKKLMIFLISLCLLCGCTKKDEPVDSNAVYEEYCLKLQSQEEFSFSLDECNIELIFHTLDDGSYRYDIIIDEPIISMYRIQAIAMIKDEDMPIPSIGLLEGESYSLIPNVVDKEHNIYKGINLSGISYESTPVVLLYLTYYTNQYDDNSFQERFVCLNENAS